ncbi:PAS domain-containing protein [Archangium violaceum]|uniref:sensor histidine kinase n=1 Tax=Archangium violaceum TaxID=83451 RepID=UPI002B2A57E3|nr:PAS domain-containing protein [Archangium violaceum]
MGALADLLSLRRGDILERFERAVRAHFPMEGRTRSAVIDTFPVLLDELLDLLRGHPRAQVLDTAAQHRAQRRDLGYDVTQIVREYGLLRDCILELLQETGGTLDLAENRLLHQGIDLAMTDAVAERERAVRAATEEQRTLLRDIIAQSGDGIIMADAQGVLRLFNPEAERQHGRPLKELTTQEWMEGLSDEEARPLTLEQVPLHRALQGELVRDEIFWIHRPDGTRLPISITARPLRWPDGSLRGAVLTSRDVALRRALAKEREEALALLDTLLATAPVGLSFIDRELRYVRINHALAAINGVPVEQTLGRTVWEVIPRIAPSNAPNYQRVFETGESVTNMELHVPTAGRGGELGYYLVSYSPVKDREGRTLMVATAVVDITERKRFEEQLRQTAEFRERFLGIVSHDLRNPLSIISLSADLLLRQETLPERSLRLAQRIALNAELMARMIGDLLDLTRGRLGGGIPITPAPTDLESLGHRVVSEVEVSHPARELLLETHGDLQGEWDADRLAQLLSNLLKNALDYSPPETPVTLALYDEGERVRMEVRNQGEPIPAELLPDLFEPFRRGMARGRSPSGLGLGLYIVRQISTAHGGTVEVRSTHEEGTVFTIRLPRAVPRHE